MLAWLRVFFGYSKDYCIKNSIKRSIDFSKSFEPLQLAIPRVFRSSRTIESPFRLRYPMLFPRDTVFLWRDPVDPKKDASSRCISAMFCLYKNGDQVPISVKRQLTDDFSSAHLKILSKISQALSETPKNGKNNGSKQASIFADSEFTPNVSIVDKTVEQVFDNASEITIMGRKCNVLREPVDISSITCLVHPIVECPVVPAIDYRDGATDSVVPVFHWFVKTEPDPPEDTSPNKKKKNKNVPVIPDKITLVNVEKRLFRVSNCLYRGTGPTYTPLEEDVGRRLVILADLGNESIVKTGLSKYPVRRIPESLLSRPITDWCEHPPLDNRMRVVSCNILADLYLNLSGPQEELFFPYCPKNYQHYDYRYPLLLREIRKFNADLYFLQEVDHRMQMRYLSAIFKEMEMEMMFAKKGAEVSEGSVIAFNKKKFSLIRSEFDILSDLLKLPNNEDIFKMMKSSEEGFKILSSRPTIVQTVLLKANDSGSFILCANTHLHHDPRHEYIKAIQALLAYRRIEQIKQSIISDQPECSLRIVFAGDFNSTPDGPVYKLFSTGLLPKDDETTKLIPSLEAEDLYLKNYNGERIQLHNLTGTPEYTNYTRHADKAGNTVGFSGCLDYIWSDRKVDAIAKPPSVLHEDVLKFEALPSSICPSDHIPLVIDINLK